MRLLATHAGPGRRVQLRFLCEGGLRTSISGVPSEERGREKRHAAEIALHRQQCHIACIASVNSHPKLHAEIAADFAALAIRNIFDWELSDQSTSTRDGHLLELISLLLLKLGHLNVYVAYSKQGL